MMKKSGLLEKFSRKEVSKRSSFMLPESIIEMIDKYVKYAAANQVEITRDEVLIEFVKDAMKREGDFQNWLLKERSDGGGISNAE